MSLTPQLVKQFFPLSTQAYKLRSTYDFKLEDKKTVHYSPLCLYWIFRPFLGLKIWKIVLLEIKSSRYLEKFKKKSKTQIPKNCQNLPSSHRFHIEVPYKHFISTIACHLISNRLYHYGNKKDNNVSLFYYEPFWYYYYDHCCPLIVKQK